MSKYLLYALGEILLVVVGILIALQINNWNEDWKTRALEMVTSLSSKDCRITSNTPRLNSGNSSKNSTPLCDKEIYPGCG